MCGIAAHMLARSRQADETKKICVNPLNPRHPCSINPYTKRRKHMYSSNVLNNRYWTRMVKIVLSALTTLLMATAVLAAAPVGQVIWLRSVATDRFVSADQNRGSFAPLVADRASVGGWEQFQIVDAGGGFIALRALSNGRYVSSDNKRAKVPLGADRPP